MIMKKKYLKFLLSKNTLRQIKKLDYAYQNNDKQKLLNFEKREKKKRKGLQRANENSFYI